MTEYRPKSELASSEHPNATPVRPPPASLACRSLAAATLLSVPIVLNAARPIPLRMTIHDDRGRPVEAVVVRVARTGDPRQTAELYSDRNGAVTAEIAGVRKTLEITVNPATAASSAPSEDGSHEQGLGPTYETDRAHAVRAESYDDETLSFALRPRLPTRQICRLTGYGAPNGPYQYAGQDSAITIPYVREESGHLVERLLWWFGDTVSESDGPILVPNKMAISDPAANAADCIRLEYLGARDQAPLFVDEKVEDEATVWIDLPLVSSVAADSQPNGGFSYRPHLGDRLHLAYLSVADTKPLFTVTHLGLASEAPCETDCRAVGAGRGIGFEREKDAIWNAPLEYSRAPEGSAFLFGDTYTILKVAERRPYCAAPPHAVDCAAERPCADGSACITPGQFCSATPHVACAANADCAEGRCTRGGVIAMQVDRSSVTDESAYRYWDARTKTFAPYEGREPDAILVDAALGNSVSVMWSEYAKRWIMISNYESGFYTGQRLVALRSSPELLGPWGEAETIMENLGGQRSYNPRFLPAYTHAPSTNLVYWTATYDAFDESWPMHGLPFDYNVFLYETDLAATRQKDLSKAATSSGSTSSLARSASHENRATSAAAGVGTGVASKPSEQAR
jgi:hypothetical protein